MLRLTLAKRKINWKYVTKAYTGTPTANDRDDLIKEMLDHDGKRHKAPLFIIMKAGQAEDSWNPNINGIVEMNRRVHVDEEGFLFVEDADAVEKDGNRKHDIHLGRRRSRQTLSFLSLHFLDGKWCRRNL